MATTLAELTRSDQIDILPVLVTITYDILVVPTFPLKYQL